MSAIVAVDDLVRRWHQSHDSSLAALLALVAVALAVLPVAVITAARLCSKRRGAHHSRVPNCDDAHGGAEAQECDQRKLSGVAHYNTQSASARGAALSARKKRAAARKLRALQRADAMAQSCADGAVDEDVESDSGSSLCTGVSTQSLRDGLGTQVFVELQRGAVTTMRVSLRDAWAVADVHRALARALALSGSEELSRFGVASFDRAIHPDGNLDVQFLDAGQAALTFTPSTPLHKIKSATAIRVVLRPAANLAVQVDERLAIGNIDSTQMQLDWGEEDVAGTGQATA
eukprot:CAMPEP_0119356244 /NCGR_PEP_ID=MMETSP1334-20130426/4889_1 /TAXON_ID=127549 /ORGANISM="Calcidiscus leptoporus, Strain RCC1130" /LENGTH=288 /DNA_ID=CAMNT_0007370233 /DNA_START=173 /DNA_END=1039 /DNA_ORIENTATION=+